MKLNEIKSIKGREIYFLLYLSPYSNLIQGFTYNENARNVNDFYQSVHRGYCEMMHRICQFYSEYIYSMTAISWVNVLKLLKNYEIKCSIVN